MAFPCCGRQEAVQGRSGLGICSDCEENIRFRKARESGYSPGCFDNPVTDYDVLSVVTNNLRIISRRVIKGETLILCEAIVANRQCSSYAKYERDGHSVCSLHKKAKKVDRYISNIPVGTPWEISVMIDLLKRNQKLRSCAASVGLFYDGKE